MLIKRVKLLLSMAVICIGAILIAPMASASNSYVFDDVSYAPEASTWGSSYTEQAVDLELARLNVSEQFDNLTADDVYIFECKYSSEPDRYQIVMIVPYSSSYVPNIYIYPATNSVRFGILGDVSSSHECLITTCHLMYYQNQWSIDEAWSFVTPTTDTYQGETYSLLPLASNYRNFNPAYAWCNFRGNIFIDNTVDYTYPYYSFTPVTPLIYDGAGGTIDTTEQTYSNVLLQEYLHENDITAERIGYIITDNDIVTQVPVSYTHPANYDGVIWIKQTQYTPYLDMFEVVCDPEYIDDYRGARAAVLYDLDVTTLDFYAVTHKDIVETGDSSTEFSVYVNDSPDGSQNLENNIGYYSFAGTTYYGTHYSVEHNVNASEPVYAIWYFNPHPLSAIPKLQPIFVGLDLTVTDGDGNETIGRDTTNYTTFVNNYNQNVISGLTGSIMGPTSFSANWSGNSPDTTINYNDTMTYDDAGLGNFFQRVFSVGNGYFTTLLLSVLAVAFAAYIIYGRS